MSAQGVVVGCTLDAPSRQSQSVVDATKRHKHCPLCATCWIFSVCAAVIANFFRVVCSLSISLLRIMDGTICLDGSYVSIPD